MNESNRAMAPSTDVRQEIMMFDAALRDSFASPPATYRPAPFLVLNDDHDDEAGAARVTQVLEGYRRIGYGGAFLHPRPGLITEYLSPEWFALIRHAVAECRQLGLTPYLYDENSYPSGVGGDHVPSRVPEAHTQYVTAVFGSYPDAIPAHCIALYRWDGDRPGPALEPAEVHPEQRWIAFILRSMQPTAWHGDTACPSLLDPQTVDAFIETTYDAYRRELGDLWSHVPAIFTDEPL
jgi:GNAT superfamily N-acetyltransferase